MYLLEGLYRCGVDAELSFGNMDVLIFYARLA